jgi:translocation and assembly module TamB
MSTQMVRKWWFWALAVCAAALIAITIASVWLFTTQGTRWLIGNIDWLSGGVVAIEGTQGDPRATFSAERIVVKTAAADITMTKLRWTMKTLDIAARRIHLAQLVVSNIDVTGKPSTTPAAPPTDLRLPFGLSVLIDQFQLDRVVVKNTAVAPIESIDGVLALTPDKQTAYIRHLSWDRMVASGSLAINPTNNLLTTLSITAQRPAEQDIPAVDLAIEAKGPLTRLQAGAAVRAKQQQLDVSALVEPWADNPIPKLDARFTDLNLKALMSGLPQTALDGTASIVRATGTPMKVQIQASNNSPKTLDAGGLPLSALTLDGTGAGADWRINAFEVQLGAGRITGTGRVSDKPWTTSLTLQTVRLDALDTRLPAATVSGKATASADAFDTPISFELSANTLAVQTKSARALPAASIIAQGKFLAGQSVTIDKLEVQSGEARLRGTVTAQVQKAATWNVQASADLENFTQMALLMLKSAPPKERAQLLQSFRINAAAQANATLNFQSKTPVVEAKLALELRDSMVQGDPLRGKSTVVVSPAARADGSPSSMVRVPAFMQNMRLAADGELQWGNQRAAWQGAFGQPSDRLSWQVELPDLQKLAPLAIWMQTTLPSAGSVRAQGAIFGTWQQAGIDMSGTARAIKLRNLTVGEAQFNAAAATSLTAPLQVTVDASQISGVLPTGYAVEKLSVAAKGSLSDHRITLTGDAKQNNRAYRANTVLSAALSRSGDGSAGWLWQGQLQQAEINQAQGTAAASAASENILRVAPVGFRLRATGARFAADISAGSAEIFTVPVAWQTVQFDTGTPSGQGRILTVQGTVGPLNLVAIKRIAQSTTPLLDQWDGDLILTGRFSIQASDQLRADLRLERTSGDVRVRDSAGGEALGLTELTAALTVNNGTWQFNHALAGRNVGALQLALSTQTSSAALMPPADASLNGTLTARVENIAAWSIFMPTGWRAGGRVQGETQFAGTLNRPTAQGRFNLEQCSARNALEGVDIKNGSAEVVFTERDITIQNVRAQAGEGFLTARGTATLGERQTLQLQARADKFSVLNRVDRQITVSGDLNARVEQQRLQLAGNLRIDNGLIDLSSQDAPALSDDVIVRRAATAAEANTPAAQRVATALDLSVNAGNALRLRGRGIDTLLRGELKFTTPGGRLAAQGQLRTELGTYAAYRQRLEIERGILSYPTAAPGNVGNPQLDVVALRTNIEPRVGVGITGTALAPRVRLFSEPEMPDSEKIAWLVLGRGFEGASRDDTKLVQEAALALLAGEKGGITGQLTQAIGLDTLSVGSRTGTDNVNETVVSLGKQISRRVFVGYERGLNSTTGAWQLIYRLTNRFTLRAQSGTDPSIDMIWTWRFD